MKSLLLIVGFFIVGFNAHAVIDKGNGGDICENRLSNTINDFRPWLIKNQFDGLELPSSTSIGEYKDRMLEAVTAAIPSCTSDKILVGESEKTCRNFVDSNNSLRIICNLTRFLETSESEKYRLVHHELAGAAGFETNNGDERSKYFISNQVEDFLTVKAVTVLGVKTYKLKKCNDKFCVGDKLIYTASVGVHFNVSVITLNNNGTVDILNEDFTPQDNQYSNIQKNVNAFYLSRPITSIKGISAGDRVVVYADDGNYFNVTVMAVYNDETADVYYPTTNYTYKSVKISSLNKPIFSLDGISVGDQVTLQFSDGPTGEVLVLAIYKDKTADVLYLKNNYTYKGVKMSLLSQ